MKKIILLIAILYSNIFSYDGVITNEDMYWRNRISAETHGHSRAMWTEIVQMPVGCNRGVEERLDQIVLVSLNILNKKPEEWLQGKYLKYVNESCDIWGSLRGEPKDFERRVDNYFKVSEKDNKVKIKDIPFYIILGVLSILPFVVALYFSKTMLEYIKRTWFF